MSRKFWNWIYLFIFFLPLSLCGLSHINMTTADHNVSNYHTETATVNYKYETNDVNSAADLIVGNIYYIEHFGYSYFEDDCNAYFRFSYLSIGDKEFYTDFDLFTYDYLNGFFYYGDIFESPVNATLVDDLEDVSVCFVCDDFYYFYLLYGGDLFGIVESCPQEYIPIESVTITESDTLVKWFDYEDDVLSVVDDMGYLLPVSAFYRLIFATPNIWLKSIFLGADLVIWASVCHIVMDLFMLLSHSLSRLFAKFGGAD